MNEQLMAILRGELNWYRWALTQTQEPDRRRAIEEEICFTQASLDGR